MFAYCLGEFRLSEGAAYKRIHAARAARRFPRLLDDITEGRLHLAAICQIAPHLTPENADEVIAAATHRSKAEIESWLATRLAPAAAPPVRARVTRVQMTSSQGITPKVCNRLAPGRVDLPLLSEPDAAQSVEPAAPQFVVHIPIGEATHAKLRRAQDLLGHAVANGDLTTVLDRALDVLIERLEARKHAVVKRPRPARPVSKRSRTIPAAVRRAVWVRDGGQCTFVSTAGKRCDARRELEYDHVVPFARGGRSTIEGLRMRCSAHNQFEADQAFGADFMEAKRGSA